MEKDNAKNYMIANIKDKINLAKKRNKIQNTQFFSEAEKMLIEKELKKYKVENYLFFGGYEASERNILIIYPEKFSEEIVRDNLNLIVKVIRIKLPNELVGEYNHSTYLSSLMKLGLERERFGDIIYFDDEAYIILLNENVEYVRESLSNFTRFKKAKIDIIELDELKIKPREFEELKIVIASNRLDNFVAEIAKSSRNKAEEYILSERVFINEFVELKVSKKLKVKDKITIRGKGKFIIDEFVGTNKREKEIYLIKKYI